MRDGSRLVSPVTFDDLPAIIAIEEQSPSPWTPAQLEGEFFGPHGCHLACRQGESGRLIGFIMGRLVCDEAEILKIAVSFGDRCSGAGSSLLSEFIERIRPAGIRKCHLELRRANIPALALYEKFDFQVTGLRNNYYSDPKDDAVCMSLSLP